MAVRLSALQPSYPCNRPWRPIRLWDVEAPTFSLDNGLTDGGKVVSLTRLPPFIPQEDSWYSFVTRMSLPLGHSAPRWIRFNWNLLCMTLYQLLQRRASGWMTGTRFPAGAKIFLFSTASRPGLGPTQTQTQYRDLFLRGVKRPGPDADHSAPSSAEVENGRAMPRQLHKSSWRGA
jgi:hypothetical protein